MKIMTEIAYSRSGYVRVIQINERFEVQAESIRGSSAHWKKLYGVYDRALALRLLESYAS